MTISVTISVNGNYKCPVSYKQGDSEESQVVSGRGHEGPKVLHIPFNHGPGVLTLSVGPEEQDNGDTEASAQSDSGGTGNGPPGGP